MALEVAKTRVEKLESDLKILRQLKQNNPQWNKTELGIAFFGFCYGRAAEDMLYMITCMSGRQDSIIEELEELIPKLKAKE